MSTRRYRTAAVIGTAVLAPLLSTGTAFADPPPVHVGDPALWGPALELQGICADPDLARRLGYNVIEGDNFGNELVGGPAADAIYGWGGDDTIFGSTGDDVLCGGFANDRLRGEQGNDAVFGEYADDVVNGDKGRDFVDGGAQRDDCTGGDARDAADDCEDLLSVP